MYLPTHFSEPDRAAVMAVVNSYPFATLITVTNGEPFASHVPFLLEEGETPRLLCHLSKANEQTEHLVSSGQAMVIFQGPDAYVSPSAYRGAGVPTWNYIAVHMYGIAKMISDTKRLQEVIESLTYRFEAEQSNPWQANYDAKLFEKIVGFDIEVTRIEAKFKLSQNRNEEDRRHVIDQLRDRSDAKAQAVADLMAQRLG